MRFVRWWQVVPVVMLLWAVVAWRGGRAVPEACRGMTAVQRSEAAGALPWVVRHPRSPLAGWWVAQLVHPRVRYVTWASQAGGVRRVLCPEGA